MTAKPTPPDREALLATLQARFERHGSRHEGVGWPQVLARLGARPETLIALQAMEDTGGEPDVIGLAEGGEGIVFCDCAAESPTGRRSLCYDGLALRSRKEHRPEDSALDRAEAMGIALLTEAQYRALQQLGEFDTKTSSWVQTPADIRKRGGALFCDRRYGHVFTYHNGAASYYAVRGFRGSITV